MRCPKCDTELPKTPAVTGFTSMKRIDRYWCKVCSKFQRAVSARDFDREDAFEDYSAPTLWDLGAIDPRNPFSTAHTARAA